MINPYEPPQALQTKKSRGLFFLGVVLIIIAIAMSILGFVGTIAGIQISFDEISQTESPSSEKLASGIRFALDTTVIGLIIGVAAGISGGILIGVSRRRGSAS